MLGKTIEELQNSIGEREVGIWSAYMNKFGAVNPVRMYDQGAAIVATQINRAHGGKANPIDFMPYSKPQDDENTVDAEQFFGLLGTLKGAKYGR